MVVQAHIDPTQISPRIKKMTQTMLRKGLLKGGWSSMSKLLARQLLEGVETPMLAKGWGSYYRTNKIDAKQLAFFDEMFEANAALEKLSMTDAQRESQWAHQRIASNLRENQVMIRRVNTKSMSLLLHLDNKEIREQVYERLLELRMPEDVAATNAVADRLDDPTPIPVKLKI